MTLNLGNKNIIYISNFDCNVWYNPRPLAPKHLLQTSLLSCHNYLSLLSPGRLSAEAPASSSCIGKNRCCYKNNFFLQLFNRRQINEKV